jgi:hypothetical protein
LFEPLLVDGIHATIAVVAVDLEAVFVVFEHDCKVVCNIAFEERRQV